MIRSVKNSVCRTYGYSRPEWSSPQGADSGRIESITVSSPSFDEVRREGVYLPAGYDVANSYSLLVVHDGNDFITYADLAVSLDKPDCQSRYSTGRRSTSPDIQSHDRVPPWAPTCALSGSGSITGTGKTNTHYRLNPQRESCSVRAWARWLHCPQCFDTPVFLVEWC